MYQGNPQFLVVFYRDLLLNYVNVEFSYDAYDPTNYLESGYSTEKDNNMYKVATSTIQTFLENEDSNKPNTILIITIISILIISIIILLRYRKIR